MRRRRFATFFPIVTLLCVAACAAADRHPAERRRAASVDVMPFDARKDVPVPSEFLDRLQKDLPVELAGGNTFKRVFTHSDAPDDTDGPALQLSGTVTEFKSGNRAERYLLGHGVGTAQAAAHVKLVEMGTGHLLLDREISGKMSNGMFGGSLNGIADQLAKEIAKAVKRQPYQER